MVVLKALRRTPGALRRNPVVLVPVLAVLLFQVFPLPLRAVDPLLGSVVSLGSSLVFIFITPFVQAGLIAMADEALDGRTALRTFVAEGKVNYLPMLVAYLALVAVNMGFSTVAFFVGLFGSVALVLGGGGIASANVTALAAVGVVVAIVVVLYLLVIFFVQFYGQAIVVDDLGAVDGLKQSAFVVRRNLASALGYSILVGVLGGLFGAVAVGFSLLLSPESTARFGLPELSLPVVVALGALVLAAAALYAAFLTVYSVSFYRGLTR